jgi:hypothetical protein
MTQPVTPRFHILTHNNGRVRISLEPIDDSAEQTFKRTIIFHLKEETTTAQAEAIADYLRDNLVGVSETE